MVSTMDVRCCGTTCTLIYDTPAVDLYKKYVISGSRGVVSCQKLTRKNYAYPNYLPKFLETVGLRILGL